MSNLFDIHWTPIKYPNSEVPKGLPSPTPQIPCPPTTVSSSRKEKEMVDGSSWKNPEFSFSTRVDEKTQANVKLDSIGTLTTQENY